LSNAAAELNGNANEHERVFRLEKMAESMEVIPRYGAQSCPMMRQIKTKPDLESDVKP